VRGHSDVISLGHVGDPPRLRDTTCVGDVGLDDIDATGLEVGSTVLSSEQSFSELQRGHEGCLAQAK